ncbi:MAG: YggS family pyridoxal phosphate-dependent enzyme [Mariprofundus sp.]|nr:YggS family pyridoxal phosphate-dependent enzyme [Mariprofundus sp.]
MSESTVLPQQHAVSAASRRMLNERWQALNGQLQAEDVKLLAISKYAPDEAVQTLIDVGQRCFGESRPQALRDRALRWPACQWHMIGPLQKNKAKYVARHAAMWHSCCDLHTAAAVVAHLHGRSLPVLIQVNIAANPEQQGVTPAALPLFMATLSKFEGLEVAGLMAMAPQAGDVCGAFERMRHLRDEMFGGSVGLLSMGMSQDYRAAVAAGTDIVRLGSILFAELDIRNNRNH